ncbi:lysylphosphatidylglycerol synthase domain-containing protein [Mariniflexile maritimum]|uniref:lysylphosphatidylglycerol synthase domain-containing protein n=1 Tax=Mariniflexile maritimum TaxID=2682493 RepID=UPI0012F64FAE|nr:lysylphosphatidylglycerol synthase domain-containing protein [Mariniflexile maritimum]
MIDTVPYKTKQFFFVLIKISIVVAAFYFIYQKLAQNSDLKFSVFTELLVKNTLFSLKNGIILAFLSFFNWFFEIVKWQQLVTPIQNISFKNALEQTLGALTASLFTPNRIGEYGAKAMYFTKDYRKRILLITLIGNLIQMGVTVLFGCVGIYFFMKEFQVVLNVSNMLKILIIGLIVIAIIVFFIRKTKWSIKGFSFEKISTFIKNYPMNIMVYGLVLSLLRYFIFSFQFYYLLTLFGIEISYLQAMMLITSMYLLASIIPSIFAFDVVVKGSVAVYLFGFMGVNAVTVLCIVTLMWVFNFVIPSVFGSYFVLKFNLPETNS